MVRQIHKKARVKRLFHFTLQQKILLLTGVLTSYFILIILFEGLSPFVQKKIGEWGSWWFAPVEIENTSKKSKLIPEEAEPLSFFIDSQRFPAVLNHELLYEEIEHGSSYIEQEAFLNIVHQIGTFTQEEILAKVQEQQAEERVTLNHTLYVPQNSVGRFTSFSGALIKLEEKTSIPKNEWGLTRMWEGHLLDREYNVISFYVLDEPVNLDAYYDYASISGIFFKLWTYKNAKQELKVTPLIIGRKLVKLKQPK